MAKYKHYDYSQGKFIPISFDKQILEGTFEHTLHYIIDNDLDLSAFDLSYKNDETGAPAYDPRILLKIVLYAYSKGRTLGTLEEHWGRCVLSVISLDRHHLFP